MPEQPFFAAPVRAHRTRTLLDVSGVTPSNGYILVWSATQGKYIPQTITATSLAADAATDTVIGNRTIDDTQVPSGNTGTLTTLLSWLGNMVKAITGKANWRTAPATTLEAANTHMADASDPHGATLTQTNLVVTNATNLNGGVEIGTSGAGGGIIDLHNSGGHSDRDARISVSGGTSGAADSGTVDIGAVQLNVNGSKVWHVNNDGAASGLDADTLDTYQATEFPRVRFTSYTGNGADDRVISLAFTPKLAFITEINGSVATQWVVTYDGITALCTCHSATSPYHEQVGDRVIAGSSQITVGAGPGSGTGTDGRGANLNTINYFLTYFG